MPQQPFKSKTLGQGEHSFLPQIVGDYPDPNGLIVAKPGSTYYGRDCLWYKSRGYTNVDWLKLNNAEAFGTEINSDADLDALLILAAANPDIHYTAILSEVHPGHGRVFSLNVNLVFLRTSAGLDFALGPPTGDFNSRVILPFNQKFQIFFNTALTDIHGVFGGDAERIPEWWGARGVIPGGTPFDSHAGIQRAQNSGFVGGAIFPFRVVLDGLYYWVSQSCLGHGKSCELVGDKMVSTQLVAMAGFGSDIALSPDWWDGNVGVGCYHDTSFKALVTYGGPEGGGWVDSFRGGVKDIYVICNLAQNPTLNMAACWCPGYVGEETIFERLAVADFTAYGIGMIRGNYTNGFVIRNFSIQSFGQTSNLFALTLLTFTNATANVITIVDHGLVQDEAVKLITTVTLMTGLSLETTYYVQVLTKDTISLSLSISGAAKVITGSTGSGTHTIQKMGLSPEFLNDNKKTFTDGNVTIATDNINITSHGFVQDEAVKLTTTGVLPGNLALKYLYYVQYVDANNFKLAPKLGGSAGATVVDISSAAGGGVHTISNYANEPIPILTSYGQASVENGTIIAHPGKGHVGIIAGMGSHSGATSIKNIHFESCWNCIQTGRVPSFAQDKGTLVVDNIDSFGGRGAMIFIGNNFSDSDINRPMVRATNLRASRLTTIDLHFLKDSRWGNMHVVADGTGTGDGASTLGFLRTSERFVLLADQWSNSPPSAAIEGLFTTKQLNIGYNGAPQVINLDAYPSKINLFGDTAAALTSKDVPQQAFIDTSTGRSFKTALINVGGILKWLLWSSLNGASKIQVEEGANGGISLYLGTGVLEISGTGKIGFGIATALAKLHVKTDAAIAAPALTLEQLDIDEPMINFVGTATADALSSISTLPMSGAPTGHLRMKSNGTTIWIPFSTNPPTI